MACTHSVLQFWFDLVFFLLGLSHPVFSRPLYFSSNFSLLPIVYLFLDSLALSKWFLFCYENNFYLAGLKKASLSLLGFHGQQFESYHSNLLLLLSRFSCVRLCATPGMAAHQAPLSLGFSRQEHWSESFSNAWKWKVKVKLLSCVWPSATPWTAPFQAPPSMGFSRQGY